jgi:DNA (cytosine-5)-methyltransferase 1
MSIPILSLFSGCGGLDLGFARAGFDVVLALDADPVAVRTYNHNHGEGIAQVADLSVVSGTEIIALLQEREKKELIQGVIGGPPCQPFSHSNVHVKSENEDPRRLLPGQYATILKELNERFDLDFFVFENVRGISFKRHSTEFDRFRALFGDAGFKLFEGLLDAQNFGVAQKRPRVFVVGFNERKYGEWDFQFQDSNGLPTRTVAHVIRGLPEPRFFERGLGPEDIPYHPNHWTMRPRSEKFKDGSLREGQNHGRSFRVLSWSQPSWTVAYGNREIHIHPSGKRRLSILEAMLIQGFDRDYQLLGTLSDQVRQVCDAVPPPVAETLATSIQLFLSGKERGFP